MISNGKGKHFIDSNLLNDAKKKEMVCICTDTYTSRSFLGKTHIKFINNYMQKLIIKRNGMRINTITQLINEHINNDINRDIPLFVIQNNFKKNMVDNVVQTLIQWKGGLYKETIDTIDKAWKKVRAYWNRKKAVSIGDHLFCPIFCQLFKVMYYFLYVLR